MKQLQEKNPHIGETTTNKATHTDLGLGRPRHALGGVRATARRPLLCPRGRSVWSSAWRPGGSSGSGKHGVGSQGAAEGGRPRASAPGPARPPHLVRLRGGASRPPSPRGPPLRRARRGSGASAERGAMAPATPSLSRGDGRAPAPNPPPPRAWAGLAPRCWGGAGGDPLVPAQAPRLSSGEVSALPSRKLAGETGPAASRRQCWVPAKACGSLARLLTSFPFSFSATGTPPTPPARGEPTRVAAARETV